MSNFVIEEILFYISNFFVYKIKKYVEIVISRSKNNLHKEIET